MGAGPAPILSGPPSSSSSVTPQGAPQATVTLRPTLLRTFRRDRAMSDAPHADEPEITLYHAAPSRGSIVHWMLEEIGAPFRFHLLDLGTGEQKDPAYLAVNPMGKVPAISHR